MSGVSGAPASVPAKASVLGGSPRVGRGPLTSAHEAVLPLVTILRQHGVSPDTITAATGLDLDRLHDPYLRVRLSVLDWLWGEAEAVLDEPAIGLGLIERYPENHMHFVAHLAMRADTIGEAILQWRAYSQLVCDADEITFSLDRGEAALGYQLLDPRFASRHVAEHYLTIAVHYGRVFTGKHITARRVNFRHADPGYPDRYEAVFGCRAHFGQARNEILFDPAIVAMPQVTADPYLARILSEQADAMDALREAPDTTYRVVRRIATGLAKGRAFTLASVASDLVTSERSLSRALRSEGTTFRELTERVRRELAMRYLERGLSVTQTAYFLGFSEPSALHHALARWRQQGEQAG